jgi:hypothetical protein
MTTFLILTGLSLFILRSQLLRVALQQAGGAQADAKLLHASPALGAASGWLSLAGAMALMLLAVAANGWVWGLGMVALGIIGGIALSSVLLPTLGSTLALGHHGGEGDKSIAEFNRRYGALVAFAVAGVALLAWGLHLR